VRCYSSNVYISVSDQQATLCAPVGGAAVRACICFDRIFLSAVVAVNRLRKLLSDISEKVVKREFSEWRGVRLPDGFRVMRMHELSHEVDLIKVGLCETINDQGDISLSFPAHGDVSVCR